MSHELLERHNVDCPACADTFSLRFNVAAGQDPEQLCIATTCPLCNASVEINLLEQAQDNTLTSYKDTALSVLDTSKPTPLLPALKLPETLKASLVESKPHSD